MAYVAVSVRSYVSFEFLCGLTRGFTFIPPRCNTSNVPITPKVGYRLKSSQLRGSLIVARKRAFFGTLHQIAVSCLGRTCSAQTNFLWLVCEGNVFRTKYTLTCHLPRVPSATVGLNDRRGIQYVQLGVECYYPSHGLSCVAMWHALRGSRLCFARSSLDCLQLACCRSRVWEIRRTLEYALM